MVDRESEKNFLIRVKDGGTYVTNQETQVRAFKTNAGGWFWLQDAESPFGEDVELTDPDTVEFLNSLVETALGSTENSDSSGPQSGQPQA